MNLRQLVFYKLTIQGYMKRVLGRTIPVEGWGEWNVPRRGAALLIANHRCWLDPIFIAMVMSRQVNWAGVDFHFNIPAVRWFCEQAGIIPISVEGGKKSRASLKIAVEILERKRGELVGIFPEGVSNFLNPSMDEKIIRFHTGFARIALEAKVPVVPIAVIGHGEKLIAEVPGFVVGWFTPLERFRHGAKMLIYESVTVNIGAPFTLEEYYDRGITKETLREISGRARDTVIRLYEEKSQAAATRRPLRNRL
ncbi:MAG: lysophospholipid acyltransferase family protein [bacterium]